MTVRQTMVLLIEDDPQIQRFLMAALEAHDSHGVATVLADLYARVAAES